MTIFLNFNFRTKVKVKHRKQSTVSAGDCRLEFQLQELSYLLFFKMEVKVDPDIVENIRTLAEVDIKNIKKEVKVDPEVMKVMEKDLLQMEVVINNVTSTFQVGPDLRLELEGLVMRGINMQYRGGNSLTYKIRQPRATATIFSSGKVNLVECRSEEEARVASRKVGR